MSALQKAEQAAWEAPELRPTFTRDGDREQWLEPCPDWCTGDGEGHDAYRLTRNKQRLHESQVLRVRQDASYGYEEHVAGADGVRTGHLAVKLIASSRMPEATSRILIVAHSGRPDSDDNQRHHTYSLTSLYPNEVRELITVLQHLLKVAGA